MASVKDVPKVIRRMGILGFSKKLWSEISDDEVFTWGSALAYAWLFAIFPFLIFLLTLAPYLPGSAKDKVMQQVGHVANSSMGGQGGQALYDSIEQVMSQHKGGLLSFGIILALWGASGGMSMTMSALNKAYYVTCTRSYIRQRLIAIALTIAAAALILLVVVLLPIGTAVLDRLNLGALGTILIDIVRYAAALALLLVIVAMIYYFGPCIKTKWQAITPGAVFSVLVWIAVGFGFAYYVTNFGSFNATYGLLGGAIVLLLFFYLIAVVLVVGAEINSIIDFETLDVQPGAADLTQAKAKAAYDTRRADEAGGRAQAKPPPPPKAPSGRHAPEPGKVALWKKGIIGLSSFFALRWVWRKAWSLRARHLQGHA